MLVNNFIIITVKWNHIYYFMSLLHNHLVDPQQLSCNPLQGSGPSCDHITLSSCSSLVLTSCSLPRPPFLSLHLLSPLGSVNAGMQGEKWRGGESSDPSWGPSLAEVWSDTWHLKQPTQEQEMRLSQCGLGLTHSARSHVHLTIKTHQQAQKLAGSELAGEEETVQEVKKLAYRTHTPKEDLCAHTRGKQALGKLPVTLSYSICLFKTTGNYQGNALL